MQLDLFLDPRARELPVSGQSIHRHGVRYSWEVIDGRRVKFLHVRSADGQLLWREPVFWPKSP